MAAPRIGASQNNQSWPTAPLPLKNATPVERTETEPLTLI